MGKGSKAGRRTHGRNQRAGSRLKTWHRRQLMFGKGPRIWRRSMAVKVRTLQQLVPGGDGLQEEKLFMKTADYIMFLKLKLNLLQVLSKVYKL